MMGTENETDWEAMAKPEPGLESAPPLEDDDDDGEQLPAPGAPPPPAPTEQPEPLAAEATDPEAPYGRKADGTPRKRPGRKAGPTRGVGTPTPPPSAAPPQAVEGISEAAEDFLSDLRQTVDADFFDQVQAHIQLHDALRAKREKLNADITASRRGLKAKGPSSKVIALCESLSRMDADDLVLFDAFYLAMRKGMKKPVQPDLFEMVDALGDGNPRRRRAAH